jgi:alpha-tubulin suppressor-like RCC1 family protein
MSELRISRARIAIFVFFALALVATMLGPAAAQPSGDPGLRSVPATGLIRIGATVEVFGTGFTPNTEVQMEQCMDASSSMQFCTPLPNFIADQNGAIGGRETVRHRIQSGGAFYYCDSGCEIRGTSIGTDLPASVAIQFAPLLEATDGTVVAWGENSSGQVGNGTTSESEDSPTSASGLQAVTVDGGAAFSLALRSDGTVWDWGQAGFLAGQDDGSSVPIQAFGIGDVTAIAAGGHFSLALRDDGTVWAWGGLNPSGELGNGTTTPSSTPVEVLVDQGTPLTGVVAIAAGGHHALALKLDGSVWAWGDDTFGQLGRGTVGGQSSFAVRVRRDAQNVLGSAVGIGAGVDFSFAVLDGGTAVGWGENSDGALANGSTATEAPFPVQVEVDNNTPLQNVTEASGGFDHSLFRTTNGTVYAAGDNFVGQLGRGNSGTGTNQLFAVLVPDLTGVSDAQAGGQNSLARLTDGTVLAWGSNVVGQLGNGTHGVETSVSSPTQVPGISSITAIGTGNAHELAVGPPATITDVTLSTDRSTSPTGITEAPLDQIPAARIPQQFGQTQSSPIGHIPIGHIPIGHIPIGHIPIGHIGTGDLPIGHIPIGHIPIGHIPIGHIELGNLAASALGSATLAEIPIYRAGGWPAILAETANLKASTPQGTMLAQLMADPNVQNGSVPELNPGSPNALRLDEINLALSPLANVSLLSVLLGDLTWNDISYPAPGDPSQPASWCDEWTLVGRNCNATPGTSNTVLQADISGFPLERSTLALRTVGDIDPTKLSLALFTSLTIFDIQLRGTPLADIELGQVPDPTKVVDCTATGVNCSPGSTQKLGDDPAFSAIRKSATFADLGPALDPITLGDLELAFVPRSALPWEDIPLSDVAFEKYTQGDGEPAHLVTYTLAFDLSCDAVAGLRADVTLPEGFRYRPGSSELSDGIEPATPFPNPSVDGRNLTWKPKPSETLCAAVVGQTRHMEISFQVMPGFDVGTFGSSASVRTSLLPAVQADTSDATVTVTDLEPIEGDSLGASPDTLIVGQITGPNDVDNYDFTATPGQVVQVTLSHLSRDLDLVLYAPVGSQPQEPLRSTPPQEIPFGKAPLADPGALGGVIPPEVVQDIHLTPGRPVAGISSLRGTDSESVSTTAVAGTGGSTEYRIQVTGYNGSFGPEPYVLLIRQFDPIALPPCQPRTFPNTGTSSTTPLPTVTASDNTLFIVDKQRLEMAFGSGTAPGTTTGDTLLADAQSLAGSGATTGVRGKVVFVDGVPAVQNAFTALDADPCSPQKNDAVVRAINDVIDGMRANTSNDFSGIRSIVIVGDDDIIPHARLLDTTGDGNERGFTGDMFFSAGGSTLHSNQFTGAFGNSYFLSDAPYGAFVPLSLAGQIAYIPQVAVGRLPGDAGTIHKAFQAFTAAGGVANPNGTSGTPTTAFVTHYDFFTDGGQKIAANLTARLGPGHVTQLGGNWTRDQFRNAFTLQSNPPDIVSPNAHYDQSRLLPGLGNATGDLSTVYTTKNLEADNPNLTLRIVFGIGCHAGLSLPDRLAGGVTADQARVDDWAQAYANQGAAVLVGNLGYGFGDTATVGFSEQLMANFSDDLFTTPSVGSGLLRAQQDYFTQMASFTPYDLKAIEEIVTWGFPMYRMPGAPTAGATPPSISPPTDPISLLPSTTIPVSPNFTKVTLSNGTAFYQADAGAQTTHGYPIVPKFVADIPPATGGLVAHGAAPISLATVGTPFDEPIHNAFGNATLDNSAREPAPASEVVYPTTLQSIGTFVGSDGSFRQQLVVTPGQFRPDADLTNDPGFGTIRRFRGTWLVTYGPANTTDFTGPDIRLVEAIELGGNTAFAVDANDGSGVSLGVSRVFVQALMADGTYQRVELASPGTPDGNGRWTGGMTGTPIEVFVFAFDKNGNSSSATQKGPGYLPSQAPGPPGGVTILVNGAAPDNSKWYTGSPSVTVTPADYELSVDGGSRSPGSTTVSGDGIHLVDIFAPSGADQPVGTISVAVDNSAPTIVINTPQVATYGVNQVVQEDYTCLDSGSGIKSCTDSNPGTKVNTAVPGPHTFRVDATDFANHTAFAEVTYIVGRYNFEGFFQPIDNNVTNDARAGQTIPVKYRITDGNGQGIADPGSFVAVISTLGGACGGTTDVIETYSTSTADLQYLGNGNWIFNWGTQRAWSGQCRTMRLFLADTSSPAGKQYGPAVAFRFK